MLLKYILFDSIRTISSSLNSYRSTFPHNISILRLPPHPQNFFLTLRSSPRPLLLSSPRRPHPPATPLFPPPPFPTTLTMSPMAYPRPRLPRLLFSGRIFTDPSTVNNDITHYDVANFRPNFNLLQDEFNDNGFWNPEGNSTFAFIDCKVDNVETNLTDTTKPSPIAGMPPVSTEPLLGQLLEGNRNSVHGKISDVDPQEQGQSHLYGVEINFNSDTPEKVSFSGTIKPCVQRDPWMSGGYVEDVVGRISAVFQGMLRLNEITPGNSPFLREIGPYIELSKTIKDENGNQLYPNGALSISFRMSDYDRVPSTKASFRYSYTLGSITPWLPGFPERFDSGRALHSVYGNRGNAYAHIQQDVEGKYSVYLNISNSLDRVAPFENKDIGDLYLGYSPVDSDPIRDKIYTKLAWINYKTEGWQQRTGGIVEAPISEQQKTIIESTPLVLVAEQGSSTTVLLSERKDGIWVRPDITAYRMQPDETVNCKFYVTKFGIAAPNVEVKIGLDATPLEGTGRGDGGPAVGVPEDAITINNQTPTLGKGIDFVTSLKTNAEGTCTFPITAGDVKNARGYIDGQMYGLRYSANDHLPTPKPNAPASYRITLKIFDKFTAPEKPSWIGDILPIFQQYANLYPGMARVVSLDDFASVVFKRHALIRAFTADYESPRYMPITREMSEAKLKMVVKWLTTVEKPTEYANPEPLFMNIKSKTDLFEALQTVLELEHATMPPYLTALYTIKPGRNQYIADVLRDVAIEEMLHFAIVCNIMNSIGVRPNIAKKAFVPKFPGPLPGGLRRGLHVGLSKCTLAQLTGFMSLEAPDQTLLPEDGQVDSGTSVQENGYSIAFLYDLIKESLEYLNKLGKGEVEGNPEDGILFPGDPGYSGEDANEANQLEGPWPGLLKKVMSLQDAKDGIAVIKEQGEGASPTMPTEGDIDPDTGLPQLAHYFRFAECVHGRRLTIDGDGKFAYNGPKVTLDEDGVYNMQDNPKIEEQPQGSLVRERMESFSRKYQALLNALHTTFTGKPHYLTEALAMMHQLTMAARPLMELPALNKDGTPRADGTVAGISFQVPFSDN